MMTFEFNVQRQTWQKDVDDLCVTYSWLPFWRPRVVIKRGRGSPWFFPHLWLVKHGAFACFIWVVISEDLVSCDAMKRRAIIAHECGHIRKFHDFIRWSPMAFLFNLAAIPKGLSWITSQYGGAASLSILAVLVAALVFVVAKLLYWFEHDADDYAVSKVGLHPVIDTLSWLSTTLSGGNKLAWVEKRIQRLRSLHTSQRAA